MSAKMTMIEERNWWRNQSKEWKVLCEVGEEQISKLKAGIEELEVNVGCHHCKGLLDAKEGVGQYECPACIEMYGASER